MANEGSYWTQRLLSRRAALRGAAVGAGGVVALSLVGCGGGDDDKPASGGTTASPAAGGAAGGTTTTDAVVDIRKGSPGGKIIYQAYADWGGTQLVTANNLGIHQGASLTHSGLYFYRSGRPGIDRSSTDPELDLATAMPEQLPDQLTYVVKIREDAKFQNGRPVTAEDVKYSYDRYAFAPDSAYKTGMIWLEKVEAVDKSTVRFTTKGPFADFTGAVTTRSEGLIMAKEYEESPAALTRFMGSGPYIMTDRQGPTLNGRFKRNPDFYDKPWPYFDEVEVLGTSDGVKKIADFSSKQTHVMYWLFEEDKDAVQKNRPDAALFINRFNGYSARPRVDLAPFNDKRVRQALSMAIDRKQLNEATAKGRGENDQWFSWTWPKWGFRKPADLPAAKYWNFDLQAAKQLMSASGVQTPFETTMHHWDPTVIGQSIVDQATLVATHWKNAGFANAKDSSLTFPQSSTTARIGNFEGVYFGTDGGGNYGFYPSLNMRNTNYAPPEGVKPPTLNIGHVQDTRLSELILKQYGQLNLEERKGSFKEIEEIYSENQYSFVTHTINHNWFIDPNLRNAQVSLFMTNGSIHFLKYWWFNGGKNP